MGLRLTSKHRFKQSVLMKVLMKLPKYLEWTCLSDFEMRLTFVSDWGIVVLRFLDMADTLTCWITLLEWQKTGNPNVHTKWQWMVLLRIWSSCKNFQQNSWMRITIHLLIVVLAPATLCMEPLELVLENLDESLRSFWKVHTWFVFWRKKNCIFTHFLEKWYSFQKQNSGKLWESVFFYNSNVHCTH